MGLTAPQIVTAGVYGYAVPSLAVGQSALHLTFAAATESQSWSQGNLYYATRPLTRSTWSTPTLVLTHSQVLPPGHTGKIWYPKIATGPGETVHIVWEQEESYVRPPTTYLTHTIWYISGTRHDSHVRWHTPLRLSPPNQPHAVRPNLAVKPDGEVYVVWSELIVGSGGLTNPDFMRDHPDALVYLRLRRWEGRTVWEIAAVHHGRRYAVLVDAQSGRVIEP